MLNNKYLTQQINKIRIFLDYYTTNIPRRARHRIYRFLFFQTMLGFLDVLGILLIGIVGSLSITGIASQASPQYKVIRILGLNQFDFRLQVAIIASLAVILFTLKSMCSFLLTKKITFFLGDLGTKISTAMYRQILNSVNQIIRSTSRQELIYSLTSGVKFLTIGVVGSFITLIADFFLLVFLFIGVYIFDPILATSMTLYFSLVGLFIYLAVSRKSHVAAKLKSVLGVQIDNSLSDSLDVFREIKLNNLQNKFVLNFEKMRDASNTVIGMQSLYPILGKYLIETSLMFGAFLIFGVQFIFHDASGAVANLAIFLAAGLRISPSILRVQQGIATLKNNKIEGEYSLSMMRSIRDNANIQFFDHIDSSNYVQPNNVITLEKVSYAFDSSDFKLSEINFSLAQGETLGIFGKSGVGKSTLLDLILGFIQPTSGSVQILGEHPKNFIDKNPGAIAFVPQRVFLIEGTFLDNLLTTDNSMPESQVNLILHQVGLETFVQNLPNGLQTQLGSGGVKLSGGELQRLGLARALINDPQILLMDESTNALDTDSEQFVMEMISRLNISVIFVTHKRSLLRYFDSVLFFGEKSVDKLSVANFNKISEIERFFHG